MDILFALVKLSFVILDHFRNLVFDKLEIWNWIDKYLEFIFYGILEEYLWIARFVVKWRWQEYRTESLWPQQDCRFLLLTSVIF